MAELETVSAIIHLAHCFYKIATVIREYSREIRNHNTRVLELSDRIQRHGEILETVERVYRRLRGSRDEDIRAVLRSLKKRVKRSRDVLEKLTRITGEMQYGDISVFRRAISYWTYDQDGGRQEVEGALSMFEELHVGIQTHLITASIFLTTLDSPRIDATRVFTPVDTPTESVTYVEEEHLSESLITAIGTRKRREVKQCLKNGDSALACDYNGCNALHYAVRAGEKRVLAELIKCREVRRNPGAVDVPDDEGETPLHLAIKLGRTELVHELVNANADVNAPDKYGRPPLERALSANRDDIVEILLEHDANENLLIHENGIDATIWQRLSQVKQIIKLRR